MAWLHKTLSYRSYSLYFFTLLILKFIYIYVHYYVLYIIITNMHWVLLIYILLLSIIPSSFYAYHTI